MTFPALTVLRSLRRPSDPQFIEALSAAERAVLAVLVMHAGDDGTCFPSIPTICRGSGFKRSRVIETLGKLEAMGAISRSRKPPHPTLYTVHHMDRPSHGPSTERTATVHHMDFDSPPHGHERLKERPNEDEEVSRVFDYWQRRRAEALGKTTGPAMKATLKRTSKIRARLAEGYTPEQLMAAVDSVLGSDFHVTGGHTDIELICRDQAHVERYRARAPRPAAGAGLTVPRHLLGVA